MTTAIGNAREITAKWYYKELWGWDLDEICTGPERGVFLKSLLTCANGDGLLTASERQWVIGRAAAGGAPEALLEELESYPATEDIVDIVGSTLATNKSRRAVVYFAIRAASSDGDYSELEKVAIRKIAKSMDISETEAEQLEDLVRREDELKAERIRRCFPDGDPFGK